jgi:glutathione S-transferase
MKVLLYDNPASGNCYKVRLILHLLGIEFVRREIAPGRIRASDRGSRPTAGALT